MGKSKKNGRASSRDKRNLKSQQGRPMGVREAELLVLAARCYSRAGWDSDAARLYETLQETHMAAVIYERQGNYELAAECFFACQYWTDAARCYERVNLFEQAADSWFNAGQILEAAWLWSRHDHSDRALEELAKFRVSDDDEWQSVAITIIETQCLAARGEVDDAEIEAFRDAMDTLRDYSADKRRRDWTQRALAVGETLKRPDLVSELFAINMADEQYGAASLWRKWSETEFGVPLLIDDPYSTMVETLIEEESDAESIEDSDEE